MTQARRYRFGHQTSVILSSFLVLLALAVLALPVDVVGWFEQPLYKGVLVRKTD